MDYALICLYDYCVRIMDLLAHFVLDITQVSSYDVEKVGAKFR